MSDGALLLITTANDADRTGHVYPDRTPIPPDQVVPDPAASVGTSPEADPVVGAATQWLADTPACQAPHG